MTRLPFPLQALTLSCGLVMAGVAHVEAQHVNLEFSGSSNWKSSTTVPASTTPYSFPDGVTRTPADFVFRSGTSRIWNLDQGATVICTQSGATSYNRFFVGATDGTHAQLTFSTTTPVNPGRICARFSNVAAMRIGENSTNSRGTLHIDGGVRVQVGYIHGEGPSPTINIANGRLDVFATATGHHLDRIAINLGAEGQLWFEDPNGTVTSAATFASYVNGASIHAPGGELVFQNHVAGNPATGSSLSGTLVTVDASVDTDGDGMPDAWEIPRNLNPNDNGSTNPENGASGDPDDDGLPNLEEYQKGTHPRNTDTDDDGLADGVETDTQIFLSASNTGTHPLSSDSDGDGVTDGNEVAAGTDPNDLNDPGIDLDGDGLPSAWEMAHALDPNDNGSTNPQSGADGDPDNDGVTNAEEFFLGTDPRVNESGYAWQPRPKKSGLLVISTHPDDEGIFFGGLIPYYTQVMAVPTVFVSMTSGDYKLAPSVREGELRSAVWTYGLRSQPIFLRFRDYPTTTLNDTWDIWADGAIDGDDVAAGRLKAAYRVAGIIRRYRPEIVATQDTNGEYGHNNHKATSQAVLDAWTLAADSSVEIEGLPAWQPKKLYVHKWGANRLFHDFWETPYAVLNNQGPRQVTNAGMEFHVTQGKPKVSTAYLNGETSSNWENHPSEWWGLHTSLVGYDSTAATFTVNGQTYSGWAKGNFLQNVTLITNGAPCIACPSPVEIGYPWQTVMPASVTDESPTTSLNLSWSVISGPGNASFSPSPNVVKPMVTFERPGIHTLRLTASDGVRVSTRDVTIHVLHRPSATVCAINCGGGAFISQNGITWQADAFFAGGSASTSNDPISATGDDTLLQSQRIGASQYAIPLANGSYLVTLHFAETTHTQTFRRRFHVDLEGTRVAQALDPFEIAGHDRAFTKSYRVDLVDDLLNLGFVADVDLPAIAAIQIQQFSDDQDEDGLPDAWEEQYFVGIASTSPTSDSDHDGQSNQSEYIAGTSPLFVDAPSLSLNPETHKIGFQSIPITGSTYQGRTRRYRIETSCDLLPDSWESCWEGNADDQWKEIPVLPEDSSRFYRLVTILE